MAPSPTTLRFYRRPGCDLCDQGRQALQAVLEERAAAGRTPCRMEEVDIEADAEAHRHFLTTIPALGLDGGAELPLAISASRIRRFLAAELDRGLA